MHSKWRYQIRISVFGHSMYMGTLVFSKLRGIQNYFPENFRCNLTFYENEIFLNIPLSITFLTLKVLDFLFLQKLAQQGSKM